MIRRSSLILFEVLLGLIAVSAILVGVGVWRLSQGPINLAPLTPYIADALSSQTDGDLKVEIEETVLVWSGWSRTIDLRVRGGALRDGAGLTIAVLPEFSVALSLRALAQGVVAPTQIEAIGAHLTLVRHEDGQIEVASRRAESDSQPTLPEGTDPANDLSWLVPTLARELRAEVSPGRPLSFLRSVRVIEGSMTVIDRRLDTVWHAPNATLELGRWLGSLQGRAELTFSAVATRPEVVFSVDFGPKEAIRLEADLFELRTAALGLLGPKLASLEGFDTPISGTASAELDLAGVIQSVDFDVTAGAGSILFSDILPDPLGVESAALRGRFDGAERRLTLGAAELRLRDLLQESQADGPSLKVSGIAKLGDAAIRTNFQAAVRDVTVAQLARYWPPALAANAREWVLENIRSGSTEEALLKSTMTISKEDLSIVSVESLAGSYRYRDLEVHYLHPMPPVEGVSGTAKFDQGNMWFETDGGRLGDLVVGPASVKIDGLDKPDQNIAIELQIEGPVRSALTLLDHEKLGLISDLGFKPSDASGRASAEVRFGFPLELDLSFDSVRVEAKAGLDDVKLNKVALDRDVTSLGPLELMLDRSGMRVTGPIRLGDLPVGLTWQENFSAQAPVNRSFSLQVEGIDRAGLDSFNLAFAPYVAGRVSGQVDLTFLPDGIARMVVDADLAGARLEIPEIEWLKPLNVPGRVEATLNLVDERFVGLELRKFEAGTLSTSGLGYFDAEGGSLQRLELAQLNFGNSRLANVVIQESPEATDIMLGSGVLDVAPFIAKEDPEPNEPEPVDQADDRLWSLTAPQLEAVVFAPKRRVQDVSLSMVRGPAGWQRLYVYGRVPRDLWTETLPDEPEDSASAVAPRRSDKLDGSSGSSPAAPSDTPLLQPAVPIAPLEPEDAIPERTFSFDYGPASEGGYKLEVRAHDVGGLLRASDLNDTVRGGRLSIKGKSDGPMPDHPLKGQIKVKDYRLVDTPVLARLLSVASFSGLLNTLGGKGIWFDRLTAKFVFLNGVAKTELLRAYGSAIGFTARGTIDIGEASLDLEGTVVPAYGFNNLLRNIPLVGPLLTGGEGEGLFAVIYDAEGPLADPKVTANPLSLLTPGFLRALFGRAPEGEEPQVFPPGPDR